MLINTKNKIKAVIFDNDGTLVDARFMIDLLYDGYHRLYPDRKPLSRSIFRSCYANTDQQTFEMLNILPEHQETFFDFCLDGKEFTKYVKSFPGINEVIKRLKEEKIFIGINTSRTKDTLEEVRLQLGDNLDLFDILVTSDIVANPKPDPESLLLCLEAAACEKDQMVYIGDNLVDQECADRAGVGFVLALWGTVVPEKFHDCIKLEKPSDILDLIGI